MCEGPIRVDTLTHHLHAHLPKAHSTLYTPPLLPTPLYTPPLTQVCEGCEGPIRVDTLTRHLPKTHCQATGSIRTVYGTKCKVTIPNLHQL